MDSEHEVDLLRHALLRLTPAQQLAVEGLVGGATHAVAAEAAGVTRETVTRWAGHHPAFRASLNLWRSTVVQEQVDAAQRIRSKALAAVEKALDKGEADPLAVLRILGNSVSPVGPAIPEELLDAECNKTRLSLPPTPVERGLDGLLGSLLSPPSDVERAENLAITRLAVSAGIHLDSSELDP